MVMNERIQKLAQQAGNTLVYGPFGGVDVAFNTEKFAELIVQECIGIVEAQKESLCEDENTWCDRDYGYEMAVNDSVDMVKKHFGVEE
jgi:hypothetical protein